MSVCDVRPLSLKMACTKLEHIDCDMSTTSLSVFVRRCQRHETSTAPKKQNANSLTRHNWWKFMVCMQVARLEKNLLYISVSDWSWINITQLVRLVRLTVWWVMNKHQPEEHRCIAGVTVTAERPMAFWPRWYLRFDTRQLEWHCIALLCWCAVKKLLTHSVTSTVNMFLWLCCPK